MARPVRRPSRPVRRPLGHADGTSRHRRPHRGPPYVRYVMNIPIIGDIFVKRFFSVKTLYEYTMNYLRQSLVAVGTLWWRVNGAGLAGCGRLGFAAACVVLPGDDAGPGSGCAGAGLLGRSVAAVR